MSAYLDLIPMLEARLKQAKESRRVITKNAKRDGRDEFNALETAEFRDLSATIEALEERLTECREEHARSGYGLGGIFAPGGRFERAAHGGVGTTSQDVGRRFAHDAATTLQKLSGETRAVISGSVDVPLLVDLPTPLFETPFPARLIDVLGNRISIDSYAFDYYRQTARVNNAAPVADLALKPTSTFTVELVSGQAQIIATLSQPAPLRIWWHFQTLVDWLYQQAYGSVMDAVEQQVISGTGSAPQQYGILNTTGTTNIGASADLPTTLRSGLTALQNLGEKPTAWCLNPADAESLDLIRWTSSSGGFLSGGFQFDTGNGFGTSDNVLGPSNQIKRVITPHVPPGIALLADFRELSLFLRDSIRIDVATQGNPTNATYDLFSTNAFVIRCEIPVGIGILRPQAFAVISLPGGS